jgi:hypothetical protein
MRRRLIAAVRRDFAGKEVRLDAPAEPNGRMPEARDGRDATAPGRTTAALATLDRGDLEDGCVRALFAIRRAVFDLNLEAVVLLGSAVVRALPDAATTALDADRLRAAHERLTAQEPDVALEFTLGRLDRARDVLIATWKAIALAHTFLEALRCYERALALRTTPRPRRSCACTWG